MKDFKSVYDAVGAVNENGLVRDLLLPSNNALQLKFGPFRLSFIAERHAEVVKQAYTIYEV